MQTLKHFLERTTPLGVVARYQREKRHKKKYRSWQAAGAVPPMPNWGKQSLVKEYIKRFEPKVFVETGTYKGKMVYAVMPCVKEIYSIELDQTHFERANRRFAGYPNIHIIQGQSGEVLPGVLADIKGTCLFWLDAHYSGGSTARGRLETPIMQEMESILNHQNAGDHIVLIDDARCFGAEKDYPDLDTLESFVRNVHPDWTFEVKDDIIRTHSKIGHLNE